jgi:hypothetical protein
MGDLALGAGAMTSSQLLDFSPGAIEQVAELARLFGVERAFAHLGEAGAEEVRDRVAYPSLG